MLIYCVVRLSLWCPSWELFWVIVTFATASVKTTHQLYACRFLVRNHLALKLLPLFNSNYHPRSA